MQDISVDIKLLELMASKICHDLISPVGAIANGVEFLEEMGSQADEEVVNLISYSTRQASAKLRTMRMAYGLGGADSSIKIEEVHQIFSNHIAEENRLSMEWSPHAPLGPAEPVAGFAKILICALILTIEALPKGGTISVAKDDKNPEITCITGTGDHAGLREGFHDAFEGKIATDDLEPKLVHAALTGLLSRHYDFRIEINSPAKDIISLRISQSTTPQAHNL